MRENLCDTIGSYLMLKLFGMERNLRSLKYIDSHSSIIYALLTLHMTDKKVSKKVKPI